MKKGLLYILILLLVIAVGLAIFFGIKSRDKDADVPGVTVSYVEDEYTEGGKMIYKVVVQRDETIDSVKYSIDNNEEVEITGVIDEAKNNDKYDSDNGKYFFESDTDIIQLTDLAEGTTHLLNIYVYNDASEKLEVYSKTFKIVA